MTQEEKQLLLKDLCARLPYVAFVFIRKPFGCVMSETEEEELTATTLQEFMENDDMHVFPYLRPMSSMTEEERKELNCIGYIVPLYDGCFGVDMRAYCKNGQPHYRRFSEFSTIEDWLNAHHFDYRGLIEMGLALEAPEGMYKTE